MERLQFKRRVASWAKAVSALSGEARACGWDEWRLRACASAKPSLMG
jgi:hypothetical protein